MMRKADLLQSRRQLTYAAAAIAIAAAVAEAGRDAARGYAVRLSRSSAGSKTERPQQLSGRWSL